MTNTARTDRRIAQNGSARRTLTALALAAALAGCSGLTEAPGFIANGSPDYRIGALDFLEIEVWHQPDFSAAVPVRPDGRVSTPLIEDVVAIGKTPGELARDLEKRLTEYVKDPMVTVMVRNFTGPVDDQIRVIGEAQQQRTVGYRPAMTALDLMIETGGLTQFAAGNRAMLVRRAPGGQRTFNVRLDDLVRDGDITANVPVQPGDILLIPQSWL